MLKLYKLQKSFDKKRPVLREITFSLAPGSAICIAGRNATGKTTLLRLASGLLLPDSGTVSCSGKIAFVPQEPVLLPELTVLDNLRLWYSAQGLDGPFFAEKSPETALGLLPFRKKRAGALSGGIKKRLSIATALVGSPNFLLLDEPFAALDAPGCHELSLLFCRLKAQGIGILFTSHEPAQIAALADDVFLLQDGRLSRTLTLSDISKEQRESSVLALLFNTAL
ncbi:ATP-binding cassette domain-containing protein [Oscillospiraceae bacterium LTW-04]|nr:ABC transporter ATP-binding protein [Oscillospiraceae bacterium MB24-C1]